MSDISGGEQADSPNTCPAFDPHTHVICGKVIQPQHTYCLYHHNRVLAKLRRNRLNRQRLDALNAKAERYHGAYSKNSEPGGEDDDETF